MRLLLTLAKSSVKIIRASRPADLNRSLLQLRRFQIGVLFLYRAEDGVISTYEKLLLFFIVGVLDSGCFDCNSVRRVARTGCTITIPPGVICVHSDLYPRRRRIHGFLHWVVEQVSRVE